MITSSHFFDKSLISYHEDEFKDKIDSNGDCEMGPWNINLFPNYHSI